MTMRSPWKSLTWLGPLVLLVVLAAAPARAAVASDRAASDDVACAGSATEIDFAALDAADQDAPAAAAKECTANKQCGGAKSYCAKAVGDCAGKGACKARPEVCPDLFKPVCGCNGHTFSNECYAARAGVNVKSEGPCPAQSQACKTNAQCSKGDFCAKETGKCDGEGTCAVVPTICPTIVDPVCGCDKKTYNNQCEAFRAKVNVAHAGKC
jgi:hypothetical protein